MLVPWSLLQFVLLLLPIPCFAAAATTKTILPFSVLVLQRSIRPLSTLRFETLWWSIPTTVNAYNVLPSILNTRRTSPRLVVGTTSRSMTTLTTVAVPQQQQQHQDSRTTTPTRQRRQRGTTALQAGLAKDNADEAVNMEPTDLPTAKAKGKRKASASSSPSTTAKRSRKKMTVSQSETTTMTTSMESTAVPITPDGSTKSGAEAKKTKSPSPKKTATKNARASPSSSSSKNKHMISPPKEDWQAVYRLVEELRRDRTAPVDTDGSEALPQRDLGLETYRFQVLVALMLSSQTKDAVVGDAMRQLQRHGLTLENIRNHTTFDELNAMIVKVGFHNTKAKNIIQVAHILQERYNGDIPPTAQEMIDHLPGVGPKMAYIVEHIAWGRQTGIGVDTHMHRMFNQLKWVHSTTTPEQTRLQLESWLPPHHWPNVNLLWVGLGQEVQQYPEKVLEKAIQCSQPRAALQLLKRLGMDVRKVGAKAGCLEQVEAILKQKVKEE